MADNAYIEIKGLRMHARHGVEDAERIEGNDFRLDIRLAYNANSAMRTDVVNFAVNYATVVDIAKKVMDQSSMLLENVVCRLRDAITDEIPTVTGGSIRVAKLNPPIDADVDYCAFVLEW